MDATLGPWTIQRDPEGLPYFYDPHTSVASRQHPSDEVYRNMYYAHKYGGAGGTDTDGCGTYLAMLISRVESRHVVDALKNLPRRELSHAAETFSRFDPEQTGVITLERFMDQWRKASKKTGREISQAELRVMFEAVDLTGTGEVDFNEFMLMQQQKKNRRQRTDRQRTDRANQPSSHTPTFRVLEPAGCDGQCSWATTFARATANNGRAVPLCSLRILRNRRRLQLLHPLQWLSGP